MDNTNINPLTLTHKQAKQLLVRMIEVIESFDGDGMVITGCNLPDTLARALFLQLRREGYLKVIEVQVFEVSP